MFAFLSSPVFWTGAAVVVTLLSAYLISTRRVDDWQKIPMCKGHKFFYGMGPDLLQAGSEGKLHHKMNSMAKEATRTGSAVDGMIRVEGFGLGFVIIVSPSKVAQAFRKAGWQAKTDAYHYFKILGGTGLSIINHNSAETHKAARNMLIPFFSSENVQNVFDDLQTEVIAMTDRVSANASSAGSIDMFAISKTMILGVVARVFFETDDFPSDVLPAMAGAVNLAPVFIFNPMTPILAAILPSCSVGKAYAKVWTPLNNAWNSLVDKKWAEPAPLETNTALWACLRRQYPDALTNKTQRVKVVNEMGLVVFAGFETTATAIATTIAVLSAEPEILAKLEAELDAAGLLVTAERREPRKLEREDLSKLTYLDAVVHESLRVFPPTPLGGSRRLRGVLDVDGVKLDRRDVIVPTWAFHHCEDVWGPDATTFRPERWTDGDSFAAVRKSEDGSLRWMPFLDGPQNCIGQHLAMMEIRLAVATTISRMHVKLDGKTGCTTTQGLIDTCTNCFTLAYVNGVWLECQPR